MEGEEQPEKEESGYQGLGGRTGLWASPGDGRPRGPRCPSALSDVLGLREEHPEVGQEPGAVVLH